MKNIKIVGARTHNLKNISLEIPKEKISVFSGISGSGKSSLAFDTIFAEGQRRFVENLSSYARQVIGAIEKPDVDSIEGIPPAISIDQKSVIKSPRSTVGTLTEAYDYLRLLFARFGKTYCPKCGREIFGGKPSQILEDIKSFVKSNSEAKPVKIYAQVVSQIRGQHRNILERFANSQFKKIRVDSVDYEPKQLSELSLRKDIPHTIEVLIYEKNILKISEGELKEIEKAITQAYALSDDVIKIKIGNKETTFSKYPFCDKCKISFPSLQPRLFSFNSPYGACSKCQGLGKILEVVPKLVIPNPKLTLSEGAIRPWARLSGQNGWVNRALVDLAKKKGFRMDVPIVELPRKVVKMILYGDEDFEGVIANLERRYRETDSEYLRQEIEQYMRERVCDECGGRRLNKFALSVKLLGKNIYEFSDMEVTALADFLKAHYDEFSYEKNLVSELLKRLNSLEKLGLGYLKLSLSSEALSGGEAQRIRLGVQFDSFLSGVLYVLDEPTIGLHPIDTQRIIDAFRKLRDEGNTVVVVEHDRSILDSADYIFDLGPGAGKNGGELIAYGTPEEIKKNPLSITGQYLSFKKSIPYPRARRKVKDEVLKIVGAKHNNLKNIDVEIPLGLFVAVTGVSGSGKSSLVYDILARALAKKLHRSQEEPGEHKEILGIEYLDKVIKIDQSPIGRTPRSNLATYTGIFTPIRELFAQTPQSKARNYTASQFSFNLKGGRCETCRGDGMLKIEMYFMPDVYVPCEECGGSRYNQETLEIKLRGKNIADILKMSVDEALDFFGNEEELKEKLTILKKVGLGYLSLGQSATALSGGEAQRVKLATELSRPSTGRTIYILDEPTTGLHFEDIGRLLVILQELVDRGNTVLVIEHNLDVIKNADWVIDMGPGGGERGGEIIGQGTPEELAQNPNSPTGKFLKEALAQESY